VSDDMLKYDYEEYRRCKARLVAAGRLPDNDTELADIEREIGRAMLYEDLANNAAECVMADDGACWILYEAANNAMLATIPLIARWRQLHAADA
jgi:hypothetical protein